MSRFKPSALLAGCFRPPFKGLLVLIWGYFVWCFLMHPQSPILSGHFYDSDDYTHLNQIIDWLKGQSWFDTVQHRMNPPEGVPIHFSRIGELPVALLTLIGRGIGLDWIDAATVAAALWPPVLLAVFFNVLRWSAEPLLPRDWTRATAYVALFATFIMFQFDPGRVDHHGLTEICALLAFGATLRFLNNPGDLKRAALAGAALAFGLGIALEILPILLVLSAFVGLWMVVKGREAALAGGVFAFSLFLISLLFLVASKSPALWLDPNPLCFSVIYVELMAGIAFCCLVVGITSLAVRHPLPRFLAGTLAFAACAVGFFTLYPDLLKGPYGAADKELTRLFFAFIGEAVPLTKKFAHSRPSVITQAYILFALVACFGFIARAKLERDIVPWFLTLVLLILSSLLAIFYQSRFVEYEMLFSIIPLTALMKEELARADACLRGRKLAATQLFILLLVGPLPIVFGPAIADNRTFNKGILLFPADLFPSPACSETSVFQYLNMQPRKEGEHPLIMNTIDQGAQILFRTPYSVVAAPYHTNAKGVLSSIRFFSSRDEKESESVLRSLNAKYVLLCTYISDLYLKDPRKEPLESPPIAKIDFHEKLSEKPTMARRLIDNEPPVWLKPLDVPLHGKILLYKVDWPAITEHAPQKEGAPAATGAEEAPKVLEETPLMTFGQSIGGDQPTASSPASSPASSSPSSSEEKSDTKKQDNPEQKPQKAPASGTEGPQAKPEDKQTEQPPAQPVPPAPQDPLGPGPDEGGEGIKIQ